jgi:rare lipoprotein A
MAKGDIPWPKVNNFKIVYIVGSFKNIIFPILLFLSGTISAQSVEYGKASYYADKFEGSKTASGELYKRDLLTAAHRTLPFGTKIRVTNVKNNKSVVVKINDRGPHIKGRVVDLSRKAMDLLQGLNDGVIDVKIEVYSED